MKHESAESIQQGATSVNKYPHITEGHPIHKLATAIHAKVKAAHPETELQPHDFFDELCHELEGIEGTNNALS